MTHQFKFGDRVKRKSDGAVGIVVSISFKSVLVFFDGNAVSSFYDADDFEIIPHPDTMRLDWLADPANKIGNVILPTECVEQHLDSLRDAIDAAMQMQATETA
nr:MAG TPA: SH3-like domain protein [Caudoviricetes sp.]